MAILSIESEISREIDFETINECALSKARIVKL